MGIDDLRAQYLARIEELLAKVQDPSALGKAGDRVTVDGCFAGTLNLVESIYGVRSAQPKTLLDSRKLYNRPGYSLDWELTSLASSLRGVLINMREEIKGGLVRSLADETVGEIIGDLVALAKTELRAGFKDVAAVLASAALEDALKRKAEELGINVEGKTMDTIVNALKGKSFFKGPQASIVASYVKLRNSAMHTDWGKIQESDVSGLIGFLEPFLLQHFA